MHDDEKGSVGGAVTAFGSEIRLRVAGSSRMIAEAP